MRFYCTLTRRDDGRWLIRHEGELGIIEASGETPEAAQEKIRGELRYRLELCPCSGESYQHLDIQVDASAG
jgi:hypothetical protein